MPRVERSEDLIAWQKARTLTRDVYIVTRKPASERDYGLSGQIQRASVSTMSNIAEGFERMGPGEFQHFLSVAKGSNAELRSQLYVALDVCYITEDEFATLYGAADNVGRVVGGLRASLHRSRSVHP